MKLRTIALATCPAAVGVTASARAKEQFFPRPVFTARAPTHPTVPWANGYADYLKLVNALGGIFGVEIIYEECETGWSTPRVAWSAMSARKGKHGGATRVPAFRVHGHHLCPN
ncbi:MAG: hypothetical protein IPL15_12815 [Comamonadaceae bacterium]|uniref:hypothetical protein n=1 Tax=Candidatus Skiveiella danica TaxID=3386177 RepID=UPI00390B5A99|nr:hypothetical protein [Comamonadaceae bacterium]